jgi:hypothetical protein
MSEVRSAALQLTRAGMRVQSDPPAHQQHWTPATVFLLGGRKVGALEVIRAAGRPATRMEAHKQAGAPRCRSCGALLKYKDQCPLPRCEKRTERPDG